MTKVSNQLSCYDNECVIIRISLCDIGHK